MGSIRFHSVICWKSGVTLPPMPPGLGRSQGFHRLFDGGTRAWHVMLVGGLVAMFSFPRNIGFLIIPIDELIFFRGVAQPPTRMDLIIWCQWRTLIFWFVIEPMHPFGRWFVKLVFFPRRLKQRGSFHGQDLGFSLSTMWCKSGAMWRCISWKILKFRGQAPRLDNCNHDHSMATVRVWLKILIASLHQLTIIPWKRADITNLMPLQPRVISRFFVLWEENPQPSFFNLHKINLA